MSLPNGAIRLNWIQSTGTQYVDTRIIGRSGLKAVVDYKIISANLSDSIFLGSTAAGYSPRCYMVSTYSSNYFTIGYNSRTVSTKTAELNTRYKVDVDFSVGSQTMVVDGETIISATSTSSINSGYSMYLFGCNYVGSPSGLGSYVLYACKLYEGSTLVRDYIPCKLSDSTVGLWDDANGVFYGNAGTGVFVAGPAAEITELEWIQSSGTQYINTGFMPNNNTRVVADFEITENDNNWKCIFGARDSGMSRCFSFFTKSSNPFYSHIGVSTADVYTFETLSVVGRHFADSNKNMITVDGLSYTHKARTFQNESTTIYLCANNEAGTVTMFCKMKWYSSQIYDNGTLVRDYIPAKTIEGEIGLYDRVFQEFYRNAGTGTFTAGPEMEHDGYTELEYVESDGNQYVDSGYIPSNENMGIDLDFMYTASYSAASLYGSESGGTYSIAAWGYPEFYVGSSTQLLRKTTALNTRYFLSAHANNGTLAVTLDGVASTSSYSGSILKTLPLFLFANNISGTDSQHVSARFFSCQIYDNGTEIRIYIPMLHPSGVAGLWDSVNERFYASASTTDLIAGPEAVKAPATPENFMAFVSVFDVSLAWDASELALGYRLYRDGVLLADQEVTGFIDTVSDSDTTYQYSLVAYNDERESAAATLAVYVPYVPDTPPPAVTGLSASVGAGFVSLRWNAAPDADGYRIYRNGILLEDTTATAYQESGLSNNQEYSYLVVAYNVRGEAPAASVTAIPRLELVTDRTQADVVARNEKGTYNASDLNRVGAAILYVADVMRNQGLAPAVSVNAAWTDEQWMNPSAVTVYLNDLAELRRQIVVMESTPQVPNDMERFTFREANDIEMILLDIDRLLTLIHSNLFYAGETFSGEV